MEIKAENISKRFTNEWIFKDFNYTFISGNAYAFLGNNGSGKSTLMQCLMGAIPISKGQLSYFANDEKIIEDEYFKYISFASPYLELIEEFTLLELIKFHHKFKDLRPDLNIEGFLELSNFENQKHKLIKHFSSGMKQRLKLALAFFFKSDVVFLDEPLSNLDEKGFEWYQSNISSIKKDNILLIASNNKEEYKICDNFITLNDYK